MIQLLREDYVIMLPISRCCIRFYGSGNRGHHLLFIFGVDTERKIFFCKDFSERRFVEFEVSFDEIKRSLDIYFREFSRESDGLLAIKVNPNSSTEIDYSKVYCEFYKLKQSFYTNEAGYGVGAINLMIYDVKRRPDEYTNADSLRNISFYLLEASKLLTYRYRIFSDEIVKHMTDLIGAKLVLRDSNKAKVDAVLDRFIPLIKSGKLELLEIENKRPIEIKGLEGSQAAQYDYASLEFLKKMTQIQNDIWKKGGKKQKVKTRLEDDFTDANYCAIHFLFRLPGKTPATFELQVLGNNVNEAKHIDDIVWKKLNGKNSADSNPDFDKLFEPFVNKKFFAEEPNAKEIVDEAKAKFNKYRSEVFLVQRKKDPLPFSKRKKTEVFSPLMYKLFPSDIEIKYKLSSSDYDFNMLQKTLQRGKRKPAAAKTAKKITKKDKDTDNVQNK